MYKKKKKSHPETSSAQETDGKMQEKKQSVSNQTSAEREGSEELEMLIGCWAEWAGNQTSTSAHTVGHRGPASEDSFMSNNGFLTGRYRVCLWGDDGYLHSNPQSLQLC